MDSLLTRLTDFGAVGIIAAIALWQVFYLTKRMLSVIDNNTKALTELITIIKSSYRKDN